MEDFEVIYETDNILGDYLKCKHCGERVERGIETVSHHWVHCLKRKEGLIIVESDAAKKILDSLSINVTP
jgi:hypothetical protein